MFLLVLKKRHTVTDTPLKYLKYRVRVGHRTPIKFAILYKLFSIIIKIKNKYFWTNYEKHISAKKTETYLYT